MQQSFETLQISARALILDLLAIGDETSYTTAQLVRAGALYGIGSGGIRSAITRLNADGRIAQIERGRYALGGEAEPLQQRLRDWRSVLTQRVPWNGGWLMAVASPVERADRNLWRRTLKALDFNGFAELDPGIWVRPDNLARGTEGTRERLAQFRHAQSLLVVSADGFDQERLARLPGLWEAESIAAPLLRTAANLDRHLAEIANQPSDTAAATALLWGRMAVRAIVHDPLLPERLCPSAPLENLIEKMDAYDRTGRALWRDVLMEAGG